MTEPSINTIKRSGSRFYVDPRNGAKVLGVTSAINQLSKPFLQYWASKLVAEEAVNNLGAVFNLVQNENEAAAIDFLKRAPTRSSGAAAETGTIVHGLVEQLNKGESLGLVHPDYAPWIERYNKFLDEFQPEFLEVETTAWSDTHGYAGTLDAIAKIDNQIVILDLKTGKGVYDSVALQLTAYSQADFLLDPDGTERPLPELDGAAVLHLRPDNYDLIPVRIGDDIFEVFLALVRLSKWDMEEKRTVLGAPITTDSKE